MGIHIFFFTNLHPEIAKKFWRIGKYSKVRNLLECLFDVNFDFNDCVQEKLGYPSSQKSFKILSLPQNHCEDAAIFSNINFLQIKHDGEIREAKLITLSCLAMLCMVA